MPNRRGARWTWIGGFWRVACARRVHQRTTNISYRGELFGGCSDPGASGVLVVLGGVVLGSPALPPGVVDVSPAPVVAVSELVAVPLADGLSVRD